MNDWSRSRSISKVFFILCQNIASFGFSRVFKLKKFKCCIAFLLLNFMKCEIPQNFRNSSFAREENLWYSTHVHWNSTETRTFNRNTETQQINFTNRHPTGNSEILHTDNKIQRKDSTSHIEIQQTLTFRIEALKFSAILLQMNFTNEYSTSWNT